MTYDELAAEARGLEPAARKAQLKRLMQHPDFAALVSLLDYMERGFASTASSPQIAPSHGAMAHAAGAKHGIETVQATLRGIFNKPARSESPPS